MTDETTELCSKKVNRSGTTRWSNFQPCGRPVHKDGLCKLHHKVEERRKEKDREWKETWNRDKALKEEADRLSKTMGFPLRLEYSAFSKPPGYTGNFVVPGDWLRKIAAEREEER